MEWVFDGIGTAIVSLIIGLFIGGTAGYKIGIKQAVKHRQTAGDNASQIQIGGINKVRREQSKYLTELTKKVRAKFVPKLMK